MSTNHETQKKNIPFGGILLILGGLFLLLQQLLDLDIGGGVFLAGLGIFFILWGATSRKAGLIVPGGIITGVSMGVFLVEEAHLIAENYKGGVFILALAVGFALVTILTQIFTPEKNWWALIVASVLALVGSGILIIESPTSSALKPIVERVFDASQYFWPLVLVALGLWIILKKKDR